MEERTTFSFSEWVRNYDTVFLLRPAFFSDSWVTTMLLRTQKEEGVPLKIMATEEELGQIASLLNTTAQAIAQYSIGYDPSKPEFQQFIAGESIVVSYDDSKIYGSLLNTFKWRLRSKNGKYNRTMVVLVDNFFPRAKYDSINALTRSNRGNTGAPLAYAVDSAPVKLKTSIIKIPASEPVYKAYLARRELEVARRNSPSDKLNLTNYKWSSRTSNYLYPGYIKGKWEAMNPSVGSIERDLLQEKGGWITKKDAVELRINGPKLYQIIVDSLTKYDKGVKVIWMDSSREGGVELMTTMYNVYAAKHNKPAAVSMTMESTKQERQNIIAKINNGSTNALICNTRTASDFIGLENVSALIIADPIKYHYLRNLVKGVYRFENYRKPLVKELGLLFYVTRKSKSSEKLGDYLAQSTTFKRVTESFDLYNTLSQDRNTMNLNTDNGKYVITDDRASQ